MDKLGSSNKVAGYTAMKHLELVKIDRFPDVWSV